MARRLDASSLSLLCMTIIYCATEIKTSQTRHSERSEESRITAATNELATCRRKLHASMHSCLHNGCLFLKK
ncbi:MAG: hypothetical protein IJW31_06160, partial [Lentisphaeria bacterium]|nr:hypothetical protein [Lentisphaeria bacterium]